MSNIETLRYTIEEVKRTQADAAKRGAVWAVYPNGVKRPLSEATSLLANLRNIMHSEILGQIETPITHDIQKPQKGNMVIIENPRPIWEAPAWKQGNYKNWAK